MFFLPENNPRIRIYETIPRTGKASKQPHQKRHVFMHRISPSTPPAIPAAPPAIPAALPAIPATLPAIPATLPAIPATLPAIPATLPAIPATLPAIPATLPAIPATLPAIPATLRIPVRYRANGLLPETRLHPEISCF
jgi:hypothetical protein